MKFIDCKHRMHDERILNVISCSLYKPTPEKLNRIAAECEQNPAIYAFVYGAILLHRSVGNEFEIMNIATEPAHRKQGIASALLSYAASVLHCDTINAETEDDAVGFYRKFGFKVISLGEKYPGITRYRCTLMLR